MGTAATDQYFGDAVFANDFRITEGSGSPHSLIFKNQKGNPIAVIDEGGDVTAKNGVRLRQLCVSDGPDDISPLCLTKKDLARLLKPNSADGKATLGP